MTYKCLSKTTKYLNKKTILKNKKEKEMKIYSDKQ